MNEMHTFFKIWLAHTCYSRSSQKQGNKSEYEADQPEAERNERDGNNM
jgi:hypothetical protein